MSLPARNTNQIGGNTESQCIRAIYDLVMLGRYLEMIRAGFWWNRSKKVTLIWFISAVTFYSIFRMALLNASRSSPNSPISSSERRSRLYDEMAKDLEKHGALFVKQGETSQSLSVSDLFAIENGHVKPLLKPVNPPVRANVLYLSTDYSFPISEAVKSTFLPQFDKVIWFQNSSLYHFSMFHASHHISPVPASESEIEAESVAVKAVANTLCPLKIVLDRVVLTSTGVLLGCWQVISGTDPVTIRAKLKNALPHAPEKQLYDTAMLHTSFARLLGNPNTLPAAADKTTDIQSFQDLVIKLNNQISGTRATVSELWYVEEYNVLALAVNGKMKVRRFILGCSKT